MGFGLSSAQANSESFLDYEHAIAQSCPAGLAIEGNEPQAPGCLDQTALPANAQGITGGLNAPSNPLARSRRAQRAGARRLERHARAVCRHDRGLEHVAGQRVAAQRDSRRCRADQRRTRQLLDLSKLNLPASSSEPAVATRANGRGTVQLEFAGRLLPAAGPVRW